MFLNEPSLLLQILDLTSNQISVLPGLMMRPLVAIETLYLEANQVGNTPRPEEDLLRSSSHL